VLNVRQVASVLQAELSAAHGNMQAISDAHVVFAKQGCRSATVGVTAARKVLGWPKRCTLAHAFLWEYS
jgi:hypothetical protein